jgi:hypothetical protein
MVGARVHICADEIVQDPLLLAREIARQGVTVLADRSVPAEGDSRKGRREANPARVAAAKAVDLDR